MSAPHSTFDDLVAKSAHSARAGIVGLGLPLAIAVTGSEFSGFDTVLIAADHGDAAAPAIAQCEPVVVDTRNMFARLGLNHPALVKA